MKYLLAISLLCILAGCQKVIEIKLDSSETRYILTGKVTDQPGGCQVSLTQSKAFSENNQFPGIGGAKVSIDDNGITSVLTESSAGVYTDSSLTGQPGHTYHLTVQTGSMTFTASSIMPQPVGLDSIYAKTSALSSGQYITVVYKDPLHVANYYHFIQYVNGRKEPSIFVSDDEFTDGITVRSQLNYNNDTNDPTRDIKVGDSVGIEMICNDAAVYQFWYSLSNGATGAGNSASPANPVSNIAGGAIGYFSAQTVRRRWLYVQ